MDRITADEADEVAAIIRDLPLDELELLIEASPTLRERVRSFRARMFMARERQHLLPIG